MQKKVLDGKFEKWVESGLSTFKIRRLVAEIYFSMFILGQKSKNLGPTIIKIQQPNWH